MLLSIWRTFFPESTPLNWTIHISYLIELVDFRVAQLAKFMDRSVGPKLTQFRYVQITFYRCLVSFKASTCLVTQTVHIRTRLTYTIFCPGIDWLVLHITRLLNHVSSTLSNVVHLKLEVPLGRQLDGTDNVGSWLHLLYHSPPCTRYMYLGSFQCHDYTHFEPDLVFYNMIPIYSGIVSKPTRVILRLNRKIVFH